MTNNDILRRIRYTFDFKDSQMIAIFAAADHTVTRAQISDWLKKEEDPSYSKMVDTELAIFLNGLINTKRGKREGEQPTPEKRLTNNMVFMKLRIALNMKAEDILETIPTQDISHMWVEHLVHPSWSTFMSASVTVCMSVVSATCRSLYHMYR